MRLTVLGCCGGIGGSRRTTALLLDDDILIDAGSGTGDLALERMALLEHIFLTHAHLDHSGFVPLPACHSVPAVGYCLDSGAASFVYSGDTTDCEEFWQALNRIENLRYLMIETTFLNAAQAAAAKSGHLTSELLARGLSRLQRPVQLFIAHMEPGKEERTMAEVAAACGAYQPKQLRQGQQFVF